MQYIQLNKWPFPFFLSLKKKKIPCGHWLIWYSFHSPPPQSIKRISQLEVMSINDSYQSVQKLPLVEEGGWRDRGRGRDSFIWVSSVFFFNSTLVPMGSRCREAGWGKGSFKDDAMCTQLTVARETA